MTRKRISYARYQYGYKEIPKGHIIYHKDGDPLNNKRSNLECISRAELCRRNCHK